MNPILLLLVHGFTEARVKTFTYPPPHLLTGCSLSYHVWPPYGGGGQSFIFTGDYCIDKPSLLYQIFRTVLLALVQYASNKRLIYYTPSTMWLSNRSTVGFLCQDQGLWPNSIIHRRKLNMKHNEKCLHPTRHLFPCYVTLVNTRGGTSASDWTIDCSKVLLMTWDEYKYMRIKKKKKKEEEEMA